MSGTFSVTGFAHEFTQLFASNSGPTIGDCAGTAAFSSSGGAGSPLTFDVAPALSGTWLLNASASRHVNTPDGLFQVTRAATAVRGSDFVSVVVPAGGSVVAPLTFKPGLLAGSFPVDVRRWGAPTDRFNGYPTFEGATKGQGRRRGRVDAQLDRRAAHAPVRALRAQPRSARNGLGAAVRVGDRLRAYVPQRERLGDVLLRWAGDDAQPQRRPLPAGRKSPPSSSAACRAGGTVTVDLPSADFRVATVSLNPPAGGSSISWSAAHGLYTLANGALEVGSANPELVQLRQQRGRSVTPSCHPGATRARRRRSTGRLQLLRRDPPPGSPAR